MPEPTIGQLRQRRGVIKKMLTTLERWFSTNGPRASLAEVEVKLRQLRKYEEQFEKVQEDLENMDATEVEGDETERSMFEERISVLEASLLDIKLEHDHANTLNTTQGNISLDVSHSDLPKLDLPKFSGNYSEYPAFIDAFNALVHNVRSRSLSDVKRFGLLKSCLEGRALAAVDKLPMTADNYPVALEILEERYSKKRLIFNSYVSQLWEMPRASSTDTLRQLCDQYTSISKALALIATQQEIAGGIVIQLLLTKCDKDTIRKWEERSASKQDLPTETEFMEYLRTRCTQLEGIEFALKTTPATAKPIEKKISAPKPRHSNTASTSKIKCPLCVGNHELITCPELLKKTPKERYNTVKQINHCIRCINHHKQGHFCKVRCITCAKIHNAILHFDDIQSPETPSSSRSPSTGGTPASALITSSVHKKNPEVFGEARVPQTLDPSSDVYTILATANIKVLTREGNYIVLRVLMDSGSQLNLISEKARKVLGLETSRNHANVTLKGVNNACTVLRRHTVIKFKSLYSDFEDAVVVMVHPHMNQVHPTQKLNISDWQIPTSSQLADHKFNIPGDVDIILNATYSNQYMMSSSVSLGKGKPMLRQTRLGWIVIGDFVLNTAFYNNSCTLTQSDSISDSRTEPFMDDQIRKFWELEEVQPVKASFNRQHEAEKHFLSTYQRMADGRFMVRLPFSKSPELLGTSRQFAIQRLISIEKKCKVSPGYLEAYNTFMNEYIELGHCTEVEPPPEQEPHYYVPHFAVKNENSLTTTFRVVFDASCATDSGYSLNELLMVGPKIQKDLVVHLLQFRSYPIALTGDIAKMYRQIDVHPDDRKFQLVVWRPPGEQRIKTYELNTVTYGTASAPFVAVRCLQELASENDDRFQLAKNAVLQNFYVDDMLAGGNTVEEVTQLYNEIKGLLNEAQMTIRKFQTNSDAVLQQIPVAERGSFLTIGDTEAVKTLGLNWLPEEDMFFFSYTPGSSYSITKRIVLAETCRLFDPLGLLQPIIVRAKMFMQRLWADKIDWDEELPKKSRELWACFRMDLELVKKFRIPRFVVCTPTPEVIELHGFCDASEKAYAACMYVRAVIKGNQPITTLLIAKTRVAPLKTVSLPRLELLACLLLSELLELVRSSVNFNVANIFLWSDSTIALKWISESPHKWTSFVATRVTKIQLATTNCTWKHVPSENNPADIASRGVCTAELKQIDMWFSGPNFLKKPESEWPQLNNNEIEVPETRKERQTLITSATTDTVASCKIMSFIPLIKHAVWPKVRRVFGYVFKFLTRLKQKWRTSNSISKPSTKIEPLETLEINEGTNLMLKFVQRHCFPEEVQSLQNSTKCKKSKINNLAPFFDDKGLIRVGGRLKNAEGLSFNEKYPILLPYEHPVTKLMFMWYHFQDLHAGPNALLAAVRQRYWPLKGKVLANQVVHNCIKCSKAKPVMYKQIMGSLPSERVTAMNHPFQVTAVDFAGPFQVHYRLRGSRPTKVYICIFICFATKAVHIEIVEDLTVDSFLNCIQRFVSRRRCPTQIWSDNATNFVGANRKLTELHQFYWREETQHAIQSWCRDKYAIEWKFSPPRSPHFNGLVEAAVKSAKYYLLRVVGLATLTLLQLSTVLAMAEAMLNSRPIIPLSCDPNDGQPLTPGHFLVGGPLNALPEVQIQDTKTHPVDRYNQVVAIKQAVWRKWEKEYLKLLQQRYKWSNEQAGPNIDDLVLVRSNEYSPLRWSTGRVVAVYPGKDSKVRVVDVKTDTGVYRRGVTELCPIPQQKSATD